MRNYAGRILIRVPSQLHKDLAREPFESGRSVKQLCLEAILARRATQADCEVKMSRHRVFES
jgi:predicted HicB family RNase H-like nuclease